MTDEIWAISENGSFVIDIEPLMWHELKTEHRGSEDGHLREVVEIVRS